MNYYEEKIKQYIQDNHLPTEHLSFQTSCHSVEDAAKSVHTLPENLVKNICLIDHQGMNQMNGVKSLFLTVN